MKHKFEAWLDSNHFTTNATHLLTSSVTCYKANAYSAALLMGYLGFLVILKDRLMEAKKPNLLPQGQWERITRELNFDDKWEQVIFDSVMLLGEDGKGQKPERDPVFSVNDSIRAEVRYWKDRRNDCAHNKDNKITDHHVECFWSFLESNLQKITVEGGKATLLNKLSRHYDRSYTPAHTDVSPLVKESGELLIRKTLIFFGQKFSKRFLIYGIIQTNSNYQLKS